MKQPTPLLMFQQSSNDLVSGMNLDPEPVNFTLNDS